MKFCENVYVKEKTLYKNTQKYRLFGFLTSTLTADDFSEGTLRRNLITSPAPRNFNEIRAQELCYQLTEVQDLNRFKRHGCEANKVYCISLAFEICGLVTFHKQCRDNVKHVNNMLEVIEENKQNMTRTSNDITALMSDYTVVSKSSTYCIYFRILSVVNCVS